MPELKIGNLRLNNADNDDAKQRIASAEKRKAAATETLDESWQRIFSSKLSDTDAGRLRQVQAAMSAGKIGREAGKEGKRFSKAEGLRLFKVLAEQMREETLRKMVEETPENYVLANTPETLAQMERDIRAADLISVDCETFGEDNGALDPWRGTMAGFSVSTRTMNYYVPLNHAGADNVEELPASLLYEMEKAKTVMHNAPFDCKWFYEKYNIDLITNLHADTRIMAIALDENRSHRLKDLLTDWLKKPSDNFDELFGNTPFNEISLDVALPYAAGDTEKTIQLYDWMMRHLNTDYLADIKSLIFDIEMPVARQFIWSDIRGIKFDVDRATKLDEKLAKEEAQIQAEIFRIIGREININSPAQLKPLLFEELKLPDYEKGSTGVRALKKIAKQHELVPKILEYREVGKLRQAFTQKLPREVKYDGKIHPWHNTWGAATGRFTCKDPNTQQIPAKRPEIRHLFTATGPDRILVSIDYSQIELRVLAHLADEPELIRAFEQGRDIHSTTAAMISNGKYTYEDIESNKDTDGHECQKLRKQAKVVNFGIVYGMGANKLGDTLGITKNEAQTIIDNYFKGYAGIKRYMDEQHEIVKKRGYITDIRGRKRRLHTEVKSREQWKLFSALRMAGNFPIQASAGTILKKAVVDLQDYLPTVDVHILSQTHDEILYDCPRDVSREVLYEIRDIMSAAVPLKVPVNCDIEIYPERWQEKVNEEEWFG
jgi:DNA polymerase I